MKLICVSFNEGDDYNLHQVLFNKASKEFSKKIVLEEGVYPQELSTLNYYPNVVNDVELLVKENKAEEAVVALSAAFAAIDSACSKNIYHANNAANKKAKLAKKVNSICKQAPVAVTEDVAPVEQPEVKEVAEEEVKPAKKTTAKKTTAKKSTTKKAEDAE